jgi:hypothetical protein
LTAGNVKNLRRQEVIKYIMRYLTIRMEICPEQEMGIRRRQRKL